MAPPIPLDAVEPATRCLCAEPTLAPVTPRLTEAAADVFFILLFKSLQVNTAHGVLGFWGFGVRLSQGVVQD